MSEQTTPRYGDVVTQCHVCACSHAAHGLNVTVQPTSLTAGSARGRAARIPVQHAGRHSRCASANSAPPRGRRAHTLAQPRLPIAARRGPPNRPPCWDLPGGLFSAGGPAAAGGGAGAVGGRGGRAGGRAWLADGRGADAPRAAAAGAGDGRARGRAVRARRGVPDG